MVGMRYLLIVACTFTATAQAQTKPLDKEHAAKMADGLQLYKQSVRRLLTGRCLKCHGGAETESKFSLVSRKKLLAGGAEGPAIVVGDSKKSRMMQMVLHRLEPHMPADGARLSRRELKDLARWIDLGAPYASPLNSKKRDPSAWTKRKIDPSERNWWAFRPLSNVSPPAFKNRWLRTPIDAFVIKELRANQLSPNQQASRQILVRRAFLDLTGLPPTPHQLAQFLDNDAPDSYPRLVDQLLSSPRFGEKWARHWLDVARFGESYGFEHDTDRKFAFHYRDFVIRAFNSNLPYNQFVRWQLAGDEIDPKNPAALVATGFLGAGVFPTQITKNEVERTRYDSLDDMLATIGTSMLGLTVGCARCHDHKFDPIPQADYYRMLSTFTTTVRSEIKVDLAKWLGRDKKSIETIMICGEGHKPVRLATQGKDFFDKTYFLNRGDTDQKVSPARQGFLQVLMTKSSAPKRWIVTPPSATKKSYRRYSFAKWITDTNSGAGHLLARVMVNRLWYHHMGRGIVNSPNDFGRQGQLPTHPELLDWMAGELIRQNWDLKAIHRLIMNSATYMQSNSLGNDKRRRDPTNRWYGRFQRRRVEAEVIRDSMLAVAGLLETRMYGKGTLDPDQRRRSIYFLVKRSRLMPMMQLFDAPEPLVSIGIRPATTIAPQALLFMNNKLVRQSARSFALQLDQAGDRKIGSLVNRAYLRALSRRPDSTELAAGSEFVELQMKSYGSAKDARLKALTDYCQVILGLNEFVYPK